MAKIDPSLLKIKLKSAKEVSKFAEDIISTVREPLIVLDKDLRVVKASQSFYDFFKVTPGETIGTLIYNLGNNQWDIPKLRELLETILPEKTTFDNFEVEHVFSTIGKRIMLLNARKIQRGSGKEQIILLAIEDITERKLAEEPLTISETRYRSLFESAKDGILILDSGTGRIVDVNPILINMLGYSKEQFINKTIFSLNFGKAVQSVHKMAETVMRVNIPPAPEEHVNGLVLLVEDDEINQMTIQKFIGSKYNIVITDSSAEALEILKKKKVDIILMDISIRGKKNGLELTKKLKASKEFSHIPVIAVTVHAFEKDKQNALEAGCDSYLAKPFSKESLLVMMAGYSDKSITGKGF
jgi:PAS domain S-box-containing protein